MNRNTSLPLAIAACAALLAGCSENPVKDGTTYVDGAAVTDEAGTGEEGGTGNASGDANG